MKTLTHKLTKDKEAKILLYKGKSFIHLIVFSKIIGHYQIIKKLQKHFTINDFNTQVGWLINKRPEFYTKTMLNDRVVIANKKG